MKRLGIITAVLAIGVIAGSIYGLKSRTAAPESPIVAVDDRVVASDLIVSVVEIEQAGSIYVENAGRTVESWTVELSEIHHLREGAGVYVHDPDSEIPPLAIGDRLIVGAETNDAGERQHLLESGPGPYLIGLRYVPLERSNGYQSEYVIRFIATAEPGEPVRFLHATSSDAWTTQLMAAADAVGRASDPSFLADWAAEGNDGNADGPIQRGFEAIGTDDRDPWDVWHNSEPNARALDIELTPPEVLSQLQEVQILVDIEDSGEPDKFLVVTSPTGIVYAASLDAGNHSATVLTAPGDPWTVFVTDQVVDGFRFTMKTVDAPTVDAVREDDRRFYLSVRQEGGRAEIDTDAIDRGAAADLLTAWAVSDAQTPEPIDEP